MKTRHSVVVGAAIAVLALGVGNLVYHAEGADAADARLQRLEDVEAIRTLLVRYGRELDKRDFAAYGALFAQDGSWKGGMGAATGPDAIARMVAAGFERMSPSLYTGSNHVMTSFDIYGRRRHGDGVVALDMGRRGRRRQAADRSERVTTRTRWYASAASGNSSLGRRSPR